MVDTGTNTGKAAFAASLAAIIIGILVLFGWFFRIDTLKSVLYGTVAMNPATALAMILAGTSLAFSLWAQHQRNQNSRVLFIWTARGCALAVMLIGLARLVAIIVGWDIGIDQWLFPSQVLTQLPLPSRIAPNVALNFLLFGVALLFVDVRSRFIRFFVEFFVGIVGFGSLLAVLGYAYHIKSFYVVGPYIPMALHSGITFLVLSGAFFLSHTDGGLLAVLAGDSAGGTMARRLLPAAVFVPIVLGWLALRGEAAGIYQGEFGEAMLVVGNILAFTILICWNAQALFRADLERKHTDEIVKRLAAIVENSDDAIISETLNGIITSWNPAAAKMFGYTASEIIGQPLQVLIPPDRPNEESEILAGLAKGEPVWHVETVRIRKDGQRLDVSTTISPIKDSDGKIIGVSKIVRDITKRKQAEDILAYERDLLRTLLDNSPDHIYFKDTQSRFIKSSNAQARQFGVDSPDELVGKTDFDFFAEAHARPAFEDEQEIIRTGQPMIGKVESELWQDGRPESWTLTTKMPFRDKDGKMIGTFGISKNITALKQVEAQLFQSQKMETVGKLAGGIAHEFNSILTAIIGQSEGLLSDLPRESPLTKNATEISKAASRAAALTRQLLAYGRKQILQPKILDLNSALSGMENTLRHLMGLETDVRLVLASGLKAVKVDAGQIEQVIMNMAINARDVMPKGGKLTLETANVSFDQESVVHYPELKPGDYVMLAITDTGTGMSAEVRSRVFEPFFSTKGIGQGTGLGLSTCYGIIKQSDGHISVYSEVARGAVFKIYLPQVEQQTKLPIQRLDSPNLPRGTEAILLVEDDPALREMSATLLGRLGYKVLSAADGIEALSLKQQSNIGRIDLLFTDIVMPHMSGKELSERVLALDPNTKILFASAYTENAIVHQGVLDKGVALLQKPFTPSALAHKLREVLDQ